MFLSVDGVELYSRLVEGVWCHAVAFDGVWCLFLWDGVQGIWHYGMVLLVFSWYLAVCNGI